MKKKLNKKDFKLSKKQKLILYWTTTTIAAAFLGLSLLTTYLLAGLPNENEFVLFVKEQKFYFPFFMTIGFMCLIASILLVIPTLKTLWKVLMQMKANGDINKEEFDKFEVIVDEVSDRYSNIQTATTIANVKAFEVIEQELKQIELKEQIVKQEIKESVEIEKERVKSDY